MRVPRSLPFWIAASASTIVSELIRSTKALTEVYGMSRISCGVGPLPCPCQEELFGAAAVDHVGRDQRAEEHAVGGQEDPHRILRWSIPMLVGGCRQCAVLVDARHARRRGPFRASLPPVATVRVLRGELPVEIDAGLRRPLAEMRRTHRSARPARTPSRRYRRSPRSIPSDDRAPADGATRS